MAAARIDLWHTPTGAPTRRVAAHLTAGTDTGALIRLTAAAIVAGIDDDTRDTAALLLEDHRRGDALPRTLLRHRRQNDRIGLRRCSYQLGDDRTLCVPRCEAQHAHLVAMLDLADGRPDLADVLARALETHSAAPTPVRARHSDPWMMLGVAHHATDTQIRASFRAAVRATHPDSGGTGGNLAELVNARDLALRQRR